jgi:hypothetical protein
MRAQVIRNGQIPLKKIKNFIDCDRGPHNSFIQKSFLNLNNRNKWGQSWKAGEIPFF